MWYIVFAVFSLIFFYKIEALFLMAVLTRFNASVGFKYMKFKDSIDESSRTAIITYAIADSEGRISHKALEAVVSIAPSDFLGRMVIFSNGISLQTFMVRVYLQAANDYGDRMMLQDRIMACHTGAISIHFKNGHTIEEPGLAAMTRYWFQYYLRMLMTFALPMTGSLLE